MLKNLHHLRVEALRMHPKNGGCIDCQRTVYIYLNFWKKACIEEIVKGEHNILRPADGKRGDN